MIHYSCDRCKREIDAKHDLRYIIRIEIEAAMERTEEEFADDHDHLLEIDDILGQVDEFGVPTIDDGIYQKNRYDLCVDCHRQFIKNPVGREISVPFGFSKN